MLTQYLQITRRLLADQTVARFNEYDLKDWVNIGRGQVAGESECIRVRGSLPLVSGTQEYAFSAITFPAGTTGVQGTLNVRQLTFTLPGATGETWVTPREWEWFQFFVLAQPVPTPWSPYVWAQFGQGANGTIWLNSLDSNYTANLDCVCYPVDLDDDSTAEAIPKLWTDAVPYFAAYLAYATVQQQDAATAMMQLYQQFVQRGRAFATPSVLPHQYPGGPDLQMATRLGVTPARAPNAQSPA